MNKIIGTSMIFLNPQRQVLMFLRDDRPGLLFRNCWDLPGGMLEGNETPEETIVREIREEIEVELDHFRSFRIYDLPDRIENSFWTEADFDIRTLTLHEGQAMKWFSEKDIRQMAPDRIGFDFKTVLLEFYQEKPWQSGL